MFGYSWKQIGLLAVISIVSVMVYNRFLAPRVGVSA